jgi:hypothetical protein
MSHILVYATAESRLHADLVIVRLKRAGISTEQLSIFHPPALRPNSARCWINGTSLIPLSSLYSAHSVSVSGALRRQFNALPRKNRFACLADGLTSLGLDHEQSVGIENSLLENRIVIAIGVLDEYELPAIYHTLRGLAVEKACTSDVDQVGIARPARSHRYHPEFVPAAAPTIFYSAA